MEYVNCGGLSVVITPGRYNSAYFEHSYLAEKTGAKLVTGQDLVVEDNIVYYRNYDGKRERVPRKTDLRAFVLLAEEPLVWHSGLTRFTTRPDSFIVNSSQGGGFKDTWVLSR